VRAEYHKNPPQRYTRTSILKAALEEASNGVPVFPCKPGSKAPLTTNGHLDATTDKSRITAWWNRYPGANPAMPTGERSGVFVLDVDADKWGFGSLEALEEEHGELPPTWTVRTGGGGLHYYFRLPPDVEIRNSAGKLGRGLDVRGEGGYVLLPGSVTEGAYEVLERHQIADAPAWLVKLLREPSVSPVGDIRPRQRSAANANADGPPILEGERDNTLASIAGKLHDGTRTLSDLEAELLEINERRCVPPLPERQVLKTARSIYKRTPCKPSRPEPSAETVEALDAVEAEMWGREWSGMGGKSERDAVISLIKQARRHGELIAAGVRVSISVRSWALATAVSKRAMLDSFKGGERKAGIISRLERAGILRPDKTGQAGTKSGAYVLLLPRAEFHHSNHQSSYRTSEEASGETLRGPFTAPRLRWSAPSRKPRRGLVQETRRVRQGVRRPPREHIKRLGKGAGAVIDTLEALGGELSEEELYGRLHPDRSPEDRKRWRPRDLRRRVLSRLEDAGVIVCAEGVVSLAPEWLEALNLDRERAGEIEAYRRDMRDYHEQSEAYRNRHKVKPERAPTEREMQERREVAPASRARVVEEALVRLFRERPEYRRRRVGQITCALPRYLGGGPVPKDREVAGILEANGLEVAV
jgi:hypothetical protein